MVLHKTGIFQRVKMGQLHNILVFDDLDNGRYAKSLKDNFTVINLRYSDAAIHLGIHENVSAILIHITPPESESVSLYEKIGSHQNYNGCPIIFSSGTDSEKILLIGLNRGSQDFLTKSMKKEEVIARIENKIQFFNMNRHIYITGSVKINTSKLTTHLHGETIDLTMTEMKIMKFLMHAFPHLCSRESINQEVWPGQKILPTTLNTHLCNLRKKFTQWEYEIQFIKSKGLELVLKDQTVCL